MEVRTNKVGDIRSYYRRKLGEVFSERESDILLFQLLTSVTNMTKAQLLSYPENTLNESELLKVHFGVKDLLKNKPIQYILGETEFYGLKFNVDSKVLIPRPETEELVELVLKSIPLNQSLRVLDMGTGSGCIAIAIKHHRPDCIVTAIDISEFALEIAEQNAKYHNTTINFKKVDFLDKEARSNLGNFDIIVSNPPYVRNSEKALMKSNVLDYEPSTALFVQDEKPLIFYEALANFCETNLEKGGRLFAEINQYLAKETAVLFRNSGFSNIDTHADLFENLRMLSLLR